MKLWLKTKSMLIILHKQHPQMTKNALVGLKLMLNSATVSS